MVVMATNRSHSHNWENGVSTFSQSFLVGCLLNLQISRTGIESRMCFNSLNSGQIGKFTSEFRSP